MPPQSDRLLSQIDPYGDTIFNKGQMLLLSQEIDNDQEPRGDDEREFLFQVQALCHEGQRKPHRYLWFLGD
jgi:hypothetical protein